MRYTALYRQWRPETFDEVVGQDATIRILKNQIKSNRIAHAYLFCGSRGTGKTSTAKVFAKAVNCLNPIDGNPCLKCETCLKLSTDSNMDIIEIDAASNNGVDEIRELRDKVKYPPVVGRYKVYIIDEVHMLSTGAFNALLKTLEEPPAHIIFILATTEPHRMPATILSRCQRFNFKRISNKSIVSRLAEIAKRTGVQVESEALYTIARWAEGSMRDALSLLDQCIGFCGDVVTNEDVLAVVGTADQGFVFAVAENIIEGNVSELFYQVEQLINDGRDVSVFLKDLINHMRNLLVIKVCNDGAQLLDAGEDTFKAYREQAQKASQERLTRAIDILCSAESEMRWSSQPRVSLEMALVKICRPEQEVTLDALLDRVAKLEQQIAGGVEFKQTSLHSKKGALTADKSQAAEEKKVVEKKEIDKGDDGDESATAHIWEKALEIIKKERIALYGFLKDCRFVLDGKDKALLSFSADQQFFMESINREENRSFIEKVIEMVIGRQVKVRCVLADQKVSDEVGKKSRNDDIIEKAIDIFGEDFVEIVDD
ncbi:DNA polymerase-3 subunit gamma/tau [Caldicoprobacter guelmensis]|uniref:DNA polymerase III subunit gamma/tau n=1 Tax=Caldicoprobacter guelmensis TaxID=1170224 RepID=UPI00195D2845|nr:DNA polymerase III subunit gamma/tau [Caldicoprobacter guelmensis]MBM7582773.1 DNA polymerase-3 subunit gamma/tau [Caldicoprobacter guelmensis]